MSVTEQVEHKTLAEALLAFQAEAPVLPKDGRNPHFNSKFTKLDTIREKVGPLLVRHGLIWQAFPCFGPSGQPALRYKLTHAASGESEEETMPLALTKADPQGQGSGITYARRYSVTAALDLVADEDDDGHQAAEGNGRAAAPAGPRLLTQTERDRVLSGIADADQNEALLFAAVGVSGADELNVEHAKKIRTLIDEATAS